jgi:ABC-2 type transport system ATP-binding protein
MDTALARQAAEGWLERFGLTDRATERVERLSHGSQQRVQLAAALLHDPELLVLDEPFSGLDPLGVETMAGVLREKARAGAAVVFSSHQLDLVEDICEDVAIIHQGQVVLTGPLEQLRQGSPIRHLEIELEAGADQMLAAVEGVVASSTTGNRHRLVVKSDLDVKSLLARLDSAGPVLHFAYTGPSLTELFREAVT